MKINDKKITLEVEYDYEEFKRIYIDALRRIPIFALITNYPNNPSNILIVVSISLIILYFYGQFSIFSFVTASLLVIFSLTIVSKLMALLFARIFVYAAAIHYKSEGKPITLHKKFLFEDQGIEITFGKNIKKIKWSEIVKATEDEKGLFIFYNNYLLDFIPKKTFDAYEELSQLKNFIRDKIGNKAEF